MSILKYFKTPSTFSKYLFTTTIRNASRKEYKGQPDEEEAAKRGLAYENHCIDVLRQFSFHVKHKGIAGDKGVDFQGFWQVAPADIFDHKSPEPHMFNIIGECKHDIRQGRSIYIRELEGVLSRWKHKQHHGSFITRMYPERMILATKVIPIIGIIVNSFGYSTNAIEAFENSKNPMIMSVVRPQNHLPDTENPTKEQLKSCLVYWRPNTPAKTLLPHMRYEETMEYSTDKITPSINLYYKDIDVSTIELPKE